MKIYYLVLNWGFDMKNVNIRNKDGSVLVVVLLVMAVLMILVTGVLTISMSEERTSIYQENKIEAHFLALSGAKATSEWLIRNPVSASQFIGATSENSNHFGNGTFQVEVSSGATSDELVVSSVGEVSGVDSSVSVTLSSLSSAMLLDKAIYTDAALDLSNMNVNGDVQSASTVTYVTGGHNSYEGEATQNTKMYYELGPFPSYSDSGDLIVNGDEEIISSSQYTNITINNGGVLTLKPQGTIMKVVINTLEIRGDLAIDTSIGGRVEIYITEAMYIKTQGLINNTYPYNLFIFIQDGKIFDMEANMELNAYVIGPDAIIYLQSDNSVINGAVIGSVLKKNNVTNAANGTINYYPLPTGIDITDSLSAYKIVQWKND